MADPTEELLKAMASVGLHPKEVVWDGSFHRFPGIERQGRGDNGYYKAYVDQRNAIFGDKRTEEMWKWPGDNPVWKDRIGNLEPLSAEEVQRRKEEAAKAKLMAQAEAQAEVDKLWDRAAPCDNHPYLKQKGIRDVPFLRSVPDKNNPAESILLIPMRDHEGKLRSIQRIWPDGTRKQMWNADATGTFDIIGGSAFKATNRIYLCEGWATGWSIHLATEGTAAVAFFDRGLVTVAAILRKKYPDAELVVCADNDRWTEAYQKAEGKKVPNPGVYAARLAAKNNGAELCIPDFANLADVGPGEKGPTDFDDLRQREGLDAVRKWLDPDMAEHADTTPPGPEPPKEEQEWSDSTGHTDPDEIMPRTTTPRDPDSGEPLAWDVEEVFLAELDLPDPEWLIEGLLTTDGVSLIGGDPKVGKTTFCRTLAAAVSEGKPFLRKEVKQGNVYYLPWEGSMRSHKKALCSMGATTVRGYKQLPPPIHGDKDRIDFLRWVVETNKPALVVCDTLGRMLGVDDIKDYSGTGPNMERIESIAREFNCHIVLIHHTRKDGGDYGAEFLGSAQIFASVDIGLSLKRADSGRFLRIAGGREAEMDMADTRLALDGLGRVIGDGTYDRNDPTTKTGRAVVKYLDEQPGWWKVADIATAIDKAIKTVRNQLAKLHENRRVERRGEPTQGYEYTIHGDPS